MENINLYEELGRDSMSVVYKGRRMGTLNYVALKCSDKAKRPEITNHVRQCQDLDHPNIVRFYEWYETRKHLWLVVELCTGGTLESVIIRDGCLPEDVVRKFGCDLVKGLEHIHKLGIIFSDLTPAKVLLDSSGMLKLGNFCYSKTETDTLEDFFSLCCTYEETGKRIYDTRHQDINIKKRFQGKPPFYSSCYSELKEIILQQEPSSPTQKVSPTTSSSQDFKNLLKRLLNKNPDKRLKHTNNELARVTEALLLDAERQEIEKEDDEQED